VGDALLAVPIYAFLLPWILSILLPTALVALVGVIHLLFPQPARPTTIGNPAAPPSTNAAAVKSPDRRVTYTGQATPYHITLDLDWVLRPKVANSDMRFLFGEKLELFIRASPKQEDISHFSDQYVEGVRKAAKAEMRLLRNESIIVSGKSWNELFFEGKFPKKTVYNRVRVYSGPEGTYALAVVMAANEKALQDLAAKALDAFELPTRPDDAKAGK